MRYVAGLVLAVGIAVGVVGETLDERAFRLYNEGKYAEAEPLAIRLVDESVTNNGPDHPGTATSLNSLAGLYGAQGKYDEAEPLYKRALAIKEKVLGPEHPGTATARSNYEAMQAERDAK